MKRILNIFAASIAVALLTFVFAAANVSAQVKKPLTAAQVKAAAAAKKKIVAAKAAAEQPPAEEEPAVEEAIAAPVMVAPAKSSRLKICVAAPKTNLAPSETAAESLRNSLVKYLSGPAAEIVALDAMVAVQQRAEALEKGCAFYLSMSVVQKKKGGGEGFGGFLKQTAGAAPLLNDIGAGKTATTISSTATRSQAKLTTAGDLAVGIKAKDEVTLEYNLFDARGGTAASGKFKTKAGKDGEDVLSGLLEKAVNDVLTAALN